MAQLSFFALPANVSQGKGHGDQTNNYKKEQNLQNTLIQMPSCMTMQTML